MISIGDILITVLDVPGLARADYRYPCGDGLAKGIRLVVLEDNQHYNDYVIAKCPSGHQWYLENKEFRRLSPLERLAECLKE